MRQGLGTVLVAAAVVLTAGCGGKKEPPQIVEVEGTVMLDGKPLNKVQVRFISTTEQGPEYIARGETDEKGQFKLTCHGQAGAVVGENRVTVIEGDIPEHLLPESAREKLGQYLNALGNRPIPPRYGNAVDSPLHVTVTADKKAYPLTLTRK